VAPAEPGQPAAIAETTGAAAAGVQAVVLAGAPDREMGSQAPPPGDQTGSASGAFGPPPGFAPTYPAAGDPHAPLRDPTGRRLPRAMEFGDLLHRLLAFIVDNIILGVAVDVVLILVVAPIVGKEADAMAGSWLIKGPVFMAVEWLYFTLMESSPAQATFGKMLLGLKVADAYGEPLTFWRAGARSAAKWLSQYTCLIGYIMAMFNDRSQTLHDVIAGTVVLVG
jgi:uncharacterized RDD family membrane protein YckC